ncbi:putative Bifunctional aspartokinase/homoserine dehydrogenase 1, chloroplastic [Nannochloris sp. 'desiccata']|nr:putative Bifunctional aspartokinase/homoserine dehydrogenase 1, chloroplastic [Chlorella desiccata (nom. nud.)]
MRSATRAMGDLLRGASEVKLGIALVGPGTVGRALLEQLRVEAPRLHTRYGIDLQVMGITNSRAMLLAKNNKPLDLSCWQESLLEDGADDASLGVLTEHLKAAPVAHRCVIDCTASDFVPRFYSKWLGEGIHIVTPNKRLNSGKYSNYAAVKELQRTHRAHYMYEGTVGAGLPIIATLKGLLDTGDQIERIEGVFSGTLSYIFNELKPGTPFSEVVSGAKRLGFTEPDPREDLSGSDVTRKVVTVARECGSNVELSSVDTESLVPAALRSADISVQTFMEQLPHFDGEIDARVKEADAQGDVLRYVGSFDAESGVCQAHLRRFPKTHPFANLNGTENIISFTTLRYSNPPLIVRGPGAGPAVTAAGVFADIVTLARYLGAPS